MLYTTELAYYKDPYQTQLVTEIIRVDAEGEKKRVVFLDATIFYPSGGGQPSDQGSLTTATGKMEIRNVQIQSGVVKHEGLLIDGEITDSQEAHLELDWARRHWNMRVHSAGHIIHDVLMGMVPGMTPVRGDHGSKPYLEYIPEIDPVVKDRLQVEVERIILEDRPIVTRETNIDELRTVAQFIPPNLPQGKPLRIIQIDGFYAMPDGGTQVKSLAEIGSVEITAISCKDGKTTIKYFVRE